MPDVTSDLGTFANVARGGSATGNWATPSNAASSNNTRTTSAVVAESGGYSPWLKATDPSESLPAGTVLTQIDVQIEVSITGGSDTVSDSAVHLVVGDTIQTSVNKNSATAWTTTEGYISHIFTAANLAALGVTAATWGETDFGVVVSAISDALAGDTMQVDHIRMVATYEYAVKPSDLLMVDVGPQ